jgi:Ca2+-binding RTX toxin-like protein
VYWALVRQGPTLTVYRNATAVGSVTLAKPEVPSLLDGAIGANGKAAHLHGNVDEVAVYNSALTPSTLLSHYQLAGYGLGRRSERCAGRVATTLGGAGADRITGTRGRDVISAGAGNDRVLAGSGSDLVCAGPGNDRVTGGRGNDRLLGQAGNDRLFGGPGNDFLFGGSGNDRITPGPGRDHVFAGPGNDRIFARDGQRDVIDCGPGHDVAYVDQFDRTRRCEVVIRAKAPRRRH